MEDVASNVKMLAGMGFGEQDARAALEAARGDLQQAVAYLTDGIPDQSSSPQLALLADTALDQARGRPADNYIRADNVPMPISPQVPIPINQGFAIPSNNPMTFANPIATAAPIAQQTPIGFPTTFSSDDNDDTHDMPALLGTKEAPLQPDLYSSPTNIPSASVVGVPSQHEEEERQMKAAIEQSLRDQEQPPPPPIIIPSGIGGVSKEDEEVARAIEQSLMNGGQDGDQSLNPHDRVKKEGSFVGLKNIGNTCYFNSLLQTYYSIPAFRDAIMHSPTVAPTQNDQPMPDAGGTGAAGGGGEDAKKKEVEQTTVQFVLELQRLFAQMTLSDRSCVDPSQVMHKLLDANGSPVHIGNQQDVSEFNHIFLQRVSEGLATLQRGGRAAGAAGANQGIVNELFEGKMLQEVVASESGGGKVMLSSSKADFMEVILNIESGDVHAAMEEYVVVQVEDYVGGKQRDQAVEKSVWFEEFPPVLMLQLQRVSYDKDLQAAVKLNAKFNFPREIFMDRYLEKHRTEALEGRQQVAEMRACCRDIEKKLDVRTNSDGPRQDIALHEYLDGTIRFLQKMSTGTDPLSRHPKAPPAPLMNDFCKAAQEMYTMAVEEKSSLEAQLADKRQKIEDSLPHLKRVGYQLFAVLVHDGQAGSGHYWVYIWDQAGRWIKFSDSRVTEVGEAEVWDQSVGGKSNTSAYCLMYTRIATSKTLPDAKFVPEALRTEITGDNLRLKEEIKRWDVDKMYERFCCDFDKAMKDAEQSTDSSIFSFERFLYQAGIRVLLEHVVASKLDDTVLHGFKNLDNHMQTKILTKTNQSMVVEDEELRRLQKLRYTHRVYLAVCEAWLQARVDLKQGMLKQGLNGLCKAVLTQHAHASDLRQHHAFDGDLINSVGTALEEAVRTIDHTCITSFQLNGTSMALFAHFRALCACGDDVAAKVAPARALWRQAAEKALGEAWASPLGIRLSIDEMIRMEQTGFPNPISHDVPLVAAEPVPADGVEDAIARVRRLWEALKAGEQKNQGGSAGDAMDVS